MPMGSPSSAMMVLSAALLLPLPTRAAQIVEARAEGSQPLGVCVTETSLHSPPISGRAAVSPFFPLRIRRKAVLEQTQPRVIEETDFDLVPVPNRSVAFMPSGPIPSRFVSTLPLRC
jgi:hypothetical protein